ncbi:hypothetical protein FRB90_009736, partial [Tulasnella sp. 427]
MTVSVAPASDIFSFVSCEDVRAHLSLLRAFHDIRTSADDATTWKNVVANSVAKFQAWAMQPQAPENSSLSVDLDILMVWHTYLLNPVKYQQDAIRLYPSLLRLEFAYFCYTGLREPSLMFVVRSFAEVFGGITRGSLTPQSGRAEAIAKTLNVITPQLSDLESAVHRQASFIEKVVRLGWSEGSTDEFLTNCIQRYGCFLELVKAGNVHSLVPTLDIDLAWHTHQLKGSKYCKETKELLGHVLNHDDSIAETELTKSFDETTTAWKVRFGTVYLGKRMFDGPEGTDGIDGTSGCGGGCNGECGSCGTLQRGSCAPGECGECGSRIQSIPLGIAGCG